MPSRTWHRCPTSPIRRQNRIGWHACRLLPAVRRQSNFYRPHDGALLYTGRTAGAEGFGTDEGIEIFPIAEWPERTAQMVDSWADGGYDDADMPYGRGDFIAFAHGRGASGYVHWVTRGPRSGSVYWWPWTALPEKQTPPLAENFAGFLDLVCNDPVRLLNDLLGGYTRFSDGSPVTEWIPTRYLADGGRVEKRPNGRR